MILEFIVTIYIMAKISQYYYIFNLCNGVHYCSGYIYIYTLHVYNQTFIISYSHYIGGHSINFDKQNLLTSL